MLPIEHDADGSEFLLQYYDGHPETYHRWAEQYYQPSKFRLADIVYIYMHRPLVEEVVRSLNPERSWGELLPEIQRIGYPVASA